MPNLALAADALADMARIINATDKSIASVSRKFRATLRSLAVSSMTSGTSIMADTRRLVRKGIEDAYIECMIANGLTAADITAADAQMIQELDLTQQDFVADFVKAITESRKDQALQRDILDNRIDLWAASMEAAGSQCLSGMKEMVVWRYGDTEHCETCLKLNGKRHSRKWFSDRNYFPRTPGAAMECGGFNCMCELLPD